jgi:murein DD-endopeptidase MepM/ murein hydrolase activator NlpD
MHSLRTLRRSLLAVLAGVSLAPLATSTAGAAEIVKPIVFPVDGPVTYSDTFGACRDACSRRHEGQDLMGKKMLPLLSAVDGVVHRVVFNNATGNSVVIKAADGWTYHYIHVNNDTPGTDDAKATRAQAFPSSIVAGASVRRGQVVAYLGDSGNAESTGSHLHFEIRKPPAPGTYTGEAINAYPSLQNATVWSRDPHWELRRSPIAGTVEDQFSFGVFTGDRGLLCDWDGDGVVEPVLYRSGSWYLRSGLPSGTTSSTLSFGTSAEQPLCANVDGDPGDEPVLFRKGRWQIRSGFEAEAKVTLATYGVFDGDQPALGDWDDDGDDDLAVHREGRWYLRSNALESGATVRTVPYGAIPGDLPVVGDWDGDGDDDLGIFRSGTWYLRNGSAASGATVRSFTFGRKGDQPVVGPYTPAAAPGLGVYRARS